jgi:hypothetical protein
MSIRSIGSRLLVGFGNAAVAGSSGEGTVRRVAPRDSDRPSRNGGTRRESLSKGNHVAAAGMVIRMMPHIATRRRAASCFARHSYARPGPRA